MMRAAQSLTLVMFVVAVYGCDRPGVKIGTQAENTSATLGDAGVRPEQPGGFEGEIHLTVDAARANGPQPVRLVIKGDRLRFEMPPSGNLDRVLYGVVDSRAHQATVLLPTERMAIILDVAKVEPNPSLVQQRADEIARSWTIRDTGTQRTVAGHVCELWRMDRKDADVHIEACVAKDLPYVDLQNAVPASWLPSTWSSMLEHTAMPLQITEVSGKGKPTVALEVKRVQPGPVTDDNFEIPGTYTRVHLPILTTGGLPVIPGFPALSR